MTAGGLAIRAERALKWSALTTIARFALQLTAQIALARMLGPENFGVYGIGMAVLTFAAFLAGGSFSWNLMLLPTVTRDDIRFAFTWQMMAGFLCGSSVGSPAISRTLIAIDIACVIAAWPRTKADAMDNWPIATS